MHVNPLTADGTSALNVNVPPFDNQQARQASQLRGRPHRGREIYGGPSLATPPARSCRRTSPATSPTARTRPTPATQWTGPTWPRPSSSSRSPAPRAEGRVIVDTDEVEGARPVLRQRCSTRSATRPRQAVRLGDVSTPTSRTRRTRCRSRSRTGIPDYPAASDFLTRPARLRLVPPEQRPRARTSRSSATRRSRANMDQARSSARPTRTARTSCGRRSTRTSTDQAPWVALFNPKLLDFLSKRGQGYQLARSGTSYRPGLGAVSRGDRGASRRRGRRVAPADAGRHGPWRLAGRRLLRNRTAMAALACSC